MKPLSFADQHLKPGSLGIVIVMVVAMAVVVVDIVIRPQDAMTRWMVLAFGIFFAWRHLIVWQRRRRQRGLELIGTSDEVQG